MNSLRRSPPDVGNVTLALVLLVGETDAAPQRHSDTDSYRQEHPEYDTADGHRERRSTK